MELIQEVKSLPDLKVLSSSSSSLSDGLDAIKPISPKPSCPISSKPFYPISSDLLCHDGKNLATEQLRLSKDHDGLTELLLHKDLFLFLDQWFDDSPYIRVHTSGSTGAPKERLVKKDQMVQSARLTCEFLNLQEGNTALLCMNLRYIGAMMMVVRSLIAGLDLIVRPASGHPLKEMKNPVSFVAMVPLQVYDTLQVAEERELFSRCGTVLIGGGPVSPELEREIQYLPNAVYSTYGMTETLSHIALRRLNGSLASDRYYPFASVQLSLSPDRTLVIDAPLVCDEQLETNDIVQFYPDGSFVILGRKDNTINTGGVKVQAEQVEKKLSTLISASFAITSVPDPKLGEKIVLLLEKSTASLKEDKLKNSNPHFEGREKHIRQLAEQPSVNKSLYYQKRRLVQNDNFVQSDSPVRNDSIIQTNDNLVQRDTLIQNDSFAENGNPVGSDSAAQKERQGCVQQEITFTSQLSKIESGIQLLLSPYECPKLILNVDAIPLTGNGKIDRPACRKIAEALIENF